VSDYGVIPGVLTYEQYFGMQLNSRRAVLRKAYFAALATSICHSGKDVPDEVVRAVTGNKKEAADLAHEINSARDRAVQGWE
jgi:hypothetical protein